MTAGCLSMTQKSVMPMCSRIWMEISQGWFALRKPSRISVEIMRCCVIHTRWHSSGSISEAV